MSAHKLSVVIASGAGGEFLFRCLDSLRADATRLGVEVIVVDRVGEPTLARLEREHPWVRMLEPDYGHRPSVPELRRAGAEAATAEILAVIEEHCVAPPHWIGAILENFSPGDSAIGGPILDHDFRRLRDWTVYFSEYHNFMPPWLPGERYLLNGANIAYDRAKVLAHRDVLDTGYWEVVLHPLLAREGKMRAVPPMGAYHTGPFDYRYYLRQRYLLSRVWGGTQKDLVSAKTRLVHLAAGPIFPLFLLARISIRVLEKKQRTKEFVMALPLLVPVVCAYSWGEWLGYLVGPGDALEEVE